MRINKFIAQNSSLSRRAADTAIENGRVKVNQIIANSGIQIADSDEVSLDGKILSRKSKLTTILMNKPVDYVCSRNGQGSKTIYELLPEKFYNLQTVGRLDKDSSGLLMLTDDGDLANKLTHPKFQKTKVYQIALARSLSPSDQKLITTKGVQLEDGPSKLKLKNIDDGKGFHWLVALHEGRNRQIRRTFEELNNKVLSLKRLQFANYKLSDLNDKPFIEIE